MNTHSKKKEHKHQSLVNHTLQKQAIEPPISHFIDNRPEAILQRKLQEMANNSHQVKKQHAIQKMADNSPQSKEAVQLQAMADKYAAEQYPLIQKKENNTGLPNNLKSGIENLSGYSMDDVNVHYNSSKPAQLQAHAYAQGTDIHLGPGQEKHLPHEAWHVVQQKQGRVKPTMQMKNKAKVNDDKGLEKEADIMGGKVEKLRQEKNTSTNQLKTTQLYPSLNSKIIQRAVNFTTNNYEGIERGHKMEATDLNKNNVGGGSETKGIDIGGSPWVRNYKATIGSPFCVQMHLLNRKLGGDGQSTKNLGWGSTALNSQHKYKIENFLNDAIKQYDLAGKNDTVIDYYRIRVDYYEPQDTTEREKAKGAMIEKLYYEAKYQPSPSEGKVTKQGMLNDVSGIHQMDSLVQNTEDMDMINHVPKNAHLMYKNGVNAPQIGTDTDDAAPGGVIAHYNNINAQVAAHARTPQPPKLFKDRCRSYYENVSGLLETELQDILAIFKISPTDINTLENHLDLTVHRFIVEKVIKLVANRYGIEKELIKDNDKLDKLANEIIEDESDDLNTLINNLLDTGHSALIRNNKRKAGSFIGTPPPPKRRKTLADDFFSSSSGDENDQSDQSEEFEVGSDDEEDDNW